MVSVEGSVASLLVEHLRCSSLNSIVVEVYLVSVELDVDSNVFGRRQLSQLSLANQQTFVEFQDPCLFMWKCEKIVKIHLSLLN